MVSRKLQVAGMQVKQTYVNRLVLFGTFYGRTFIVLNIVKCTHVIGRQIWKFSQTKFTSGWRNRAKFPKPTNPNLAAIGRITSAVNQYLKTCYLVSGILGPGRNPENLLGHLRNIIIPIGKLILSCHFCDAWHLCGTCSFFQYVTKRFSLWMRIIHNLW